MNKPMPILHIDIVGFSKHSSDERETLLLCLQEVIEASGRFFSPYTEVWKKWSRHGTGDGYYLLLDHLHPVIALKYSLEIYKAIILHNSTNKELAIKLRMVLGYGHISLVGDQFHGDVLIQASRLSDSENFRRLADQLTPESPCVLAATTLFTVNLKRAPPDDIVNPSLTWSDFSTTDKHGIVHFGKFITL